MREANFLTDKSQLVTVSIPVGVTIDSNSIKYYFSQSNTNALQGKVVNRIRFVGVETDDAPDNTLLKVNGVAVYAPFGNTVIYFTLKDKLGNVLIDSGNLYDYSQPSATVDAASRRIYAPVRRMALIPDWQKSYLTLTTVTPVTRVVPSLITLQISYTDPK